MEREQTLRQAICWAGRRLYEQGFAAANDGNISVRLDENRILTTPTGVSKGELTPEMLVLVDTNGKILAGEGVLPPNWPCIYGFMLAGPM